MCEFMRCARHITEAFFYLLLLGYRGSLHAYYEYAAQRKMDETAVAWWRVENCVSEVLRMAVRAAELHACNKLDEAEVLAVEAAKKLRDR